MRELTVALSDGKNRSPITCEVAAGGTLTVSGRIQAQSLVDRIAKAGILLVRYYSVDGKEVSAADLTFSPKYKCGYKYLAASKEAESFSFDLSVPDDAVQAEISVCRFACRGEVLLSDFKYDFVAPGPN